MSKCDYYGGTSTNSSSNESAQYSNRIYKPPSEFGDSREQSEAECDRLAAREMSNRIGFANASIPGNAKASNKNYREGVQEKYNEEATLITNRIYEHQ